MTTRELPPLEWGALEGTELESVWPVLDPDTSRVLVVEDEGQIVACWAFFRLIHAEGIWIKPSHRGRMSVVRRVLSGLCRIVPEMGGRAVNTAATSDEVADLLIRLGAVELKGRHFSLGV